MSMGYSCSLHWGVVKTKYLQYTGVIFLCWKVYVLSIYMYVWINIVLSTNKKIFQLKTYILLRGSCTFLQKCPTFSFSYGRFSAGLVTSEIVLKVMMIRTANSLCLGLVIYIKRNFRPIQSTPFSWEDLRTGSQCFYTMIHRACQAVFYSCICKDGVSGRGIAKSEKHINTVRIVSTGKVAVMNWYNLF